MGLERRGIPGRQADGDRGGEVLRRGYRLRTVHVLYGAPRASRGARTGLSEPGERRVLPVRDRRLARRSRSDALRVAQLRLVASYCWRGRTVGAAVEHERRRVADSDA